MKQIYGNKDMLKPFQTKEFYKCLNRILMKRKTSGLTSYMVLYFKPSSRLQTIHIPSQLQGCALKLVFYARIWRQVCMKTDFFPLWAAPPWELERSELNHRAPNKILILILKLAKNWWKLSKPPLLCVSHISNKVPEQGSTAIALFSKRQCYREIEGFIWKREKRKCVKISYFGSRR